MLRYPSFHLLHQEVLIDGVEEAPDTLTTGKHLRRLHEQLQRGRFIPRRETLGALPQPPWRFCRVAEVTSRPPENWSGGQRLSGNVHKPANPWRRGDWLIRFHGDNRSTVGLRGPADRARSR